MGGPFSLNAVTRCARSCSSPKKNRDKEKSAIFDVRLTEEKKKSMAVAAPPRCEGSGFTTGQRTKKGRLE